MRIQRIIGGPAPAGGGDIVLGEGLQVLLCPDAEAVIAMREFLAGALTVQGPGDSPAAIECVLDDGRIVEWGSHQIVENAVLRAAMIGDALSADEATLERTARDVQDLLLTGTVDDALRIVHDRAQRIGAPGAGEDALLNRVARKMRELDDERTEAIRRADEIAAHDGQRVAAPEELSAMRARQSHIERRLAAHERESNARRVAEAERLAEKVADATKRSFALSAARDFPLDLAVDFQRIETRVLTARSQVDQIRKQFKQTVQRYEEERAQIESLPQPQTDPFPEALATQIQEADARTQRAHQRVEDIQAELSEWQDRVQEASAALDELPDFSRLASDPLEWLNQLANTFTIHRQARDTERDKRDKLQAELDEYHARIEGPIEVFDHMDDVLDEVRNYEVDVRVAEKERGNLHSRLTSLKAAATDHEAAIPASVWMAGVMVALSAGLFFVLEFQGTPGAAVSAILALAGAAYFAVNTLYARSAAKNCRDEIAQALARLDTLDSELARRNETMDAMLRQADCQTPRELAAYYEGFRNDCDHHTALREALVDQEAKVREDEQHVANLYKTVCESFRKAGVEVQSEDDVSAAAARAMGRYQEYRDAKRRHAEGRARLKTLREELAAARAEAEEADSQEVEAALALRAALRQAGFRDESKHQTAVGALKAYRIRLAQVQSRRARLLVLQEKVAEQQRQLEVEEQDRNQLEEELNRQLAAFGVGSIEEWHELAEQAKEYREIWQERTAAQEQLNALLAGDDLDTLRRKVEFTDDDPLESDDDPEALTEELDALNREIEEKLKTLRASEQAIAELAAQPTLNEIDEEIAALQSQRETLQRELDANAYAATILEAIKDASSSVSHDVLSHKSSEYMHRLSADPYTGVTWTPDFELRIADGEGELSRETGLQLRIACRLAVIDILGPSETTPLILAANLHSETHDTVELLMQTLARAADERQVILITANETAADSAKRIQAAAARR